MKYNSKKADYMLPTNDFTFKRIFAYEGNEDITKDLISSIIGKEIKSIEFKNPYLLRDFRDDREEILDIKAVLDNDIQCDIEMQVTNYHDIDKRLLANWAKMYNTTIHKGDEDYSKMQRTIIILIAAFNVDNLKDIADDYYTRWKIMEENRKIPLTNVFDLVIIELGKAKKLLKEGKFETKGNLGEWINFFIKPYEVMEEKKMDELDEKIRKAYEEFQKLNENEEERNLAEHRYMELKRIKHLKEYEFNAGKEKRYC
jgi:predicted transposase/invertase (TIGR01784 family)